MTGSRTHGAGREWRRSLGRVIGAAVALAVGSSAVAEAPYSGGATTIVLQKDQLADRNAFAYPAPNLGLTRRDGFFIGNSFFRNAWVTAPASTTARDGLGPVFNANACQSCHVRDGRGRPPTSQEEMATMLVRISADVPHDPAKLRRNGVVAHPVYGGQIQNHGIPNVPAEARVELDWSETRARYPDGTPYALRTPTVRFEDLAHGAPEPALLTSARVAPSLVGIGLLDTIAEAAIVAREDPDDADGDGISGRANRVWDVQEKRTVVGRFGWKSGQPTALQQVAAAFNGDIGITSSLFPAHECTKAQSACRKSPDGGKPEVSDEILDFVNFYTKTLAVPARRGHEDPFVVEGEALFGSLGCETCHASTWQTGEDPQFPELSDQEIHPYSDLLLHDMGEALADGRPDFEASGREWRTPPLWGIGLVRRVNQHTFFLHDGRARNLEEAILWHGGEAEKSRDAFVALDRQDRRRVIAFLRSL